MTTPQMAFLLVPIAAVLGWFAESKPNQIDPRQAFACQMFYGQRAAAKFADPLGRIIDEARGRRFAMLATVPSKGSGAMRVTVADCSRIDHAAVQSGLLRPDYLSRNRW